MSTVLKNAVLLDGRIKNVRADVLVEGENISAIGGNLQGDEIIDLAGATLMPAFVDAHMHMISDTFDYSDKPLREWAQHGVLTLRDMGMGNGKGCDDFLNWYATVDKTQCAEVFSAGQCIAAVGGYMHKMGPHENGIGCPTPESAADAIYRQVGMGCSGVKTAMDIDMFDENTPQHSPEVLQAIAKTAKKLDVWCSAHVLQSRFLRILVENGIPEMAHMVLDPIPEDLLDEMVLKNIPITCTLHCINAPRPELPQSLIDSMPPKMRRVMELTSQVDTAAQERCAIENLRRFHEKGGMAVMGTDTMRMETQPGVACMPVHELQLMAKAGLSVQDVIATATINAAVAMKLEDRQGTIEVGKLAKLIAVKAPIDTDFEALRDVPFVMNRGVVIKNNL